MQRVVSRFASRLIQSLAGGVVALLVTGTAAAAPIQVTDDRSVVVTLEAPPARVATVSTFAADMLVALDKTPVATSTFGQEPVPSFLGEKMAEVPSLGQRAETNLELLAQVKPDLTIAIRRYTEPHARKFEEIAPYIAFDVITLEDSLRAVSAMGQALGEPARAVELNRGFQSQLETFASRAPGGLTAAMLVGSGEAPYAYYDHYLPARLLGVLKAENVIGASPEAGSIPMGYRPSLETLLQQDPDVLFVFPSPQQRAFVANPIWPHLKAVKTGRVYEVGQHWKEGGGPLARRMILEEMAHLLYPERFPAPEIPEALRSRPLAAL